MTSQDPVTSKSHTFQDHHGDVRSRARTVSCFLAFSGLFPGLSLSHCFFLSFFFFFFFEIERFQFPFLVSLLFLFVLVHGHFCSGWLLDFPAPFPSCQYVIPSEKYTSMTSVDCRVISSLHVSTVKRNESATGTQLCQNTSVRRLQVCFRGGSAAGGQQANSSSIPRRWHELMHEWKQQEAHIANRRDQAAEY